jgi:cytochrome c biogenesis protein CcdA
MSDPQYYLVQLVFGVLCVAGAWYFWRRNQRRSKPNMADRMSMLLRLLNPVTAGLVGILFSVSGFPASLPYLGALEKLAQAYGPSGAIPGALYYNLIYVVPVLVPFGFYLALRHRVADIEAKLHLQGQKWASVVNYGLTAVLGLLFLADSTVYFATGRALLSNKFF